MPAATQPMCMVLMVLMVLLAPGSSKRVHRMTNTDTKAATVEAHSQTLDDVSAHESEGFRVPGHTALGSRKVVALSAEADGHCKNVLQKVREIASTWMLESGGDTEPSEIFDEAAQLVTDIDNGATGSHVLDEIEEVVSAAGFQETMKAGHSHQVETASDINFWLYCETGKNEKLEENIHTKSGEEITQGDMVTPPAEDGNSLLEFESAIHNGSRWAGRPWRNNKVQWCFSPTISRRAKASWYEAVEHVNRQIPCLKFKDVGSYSETSCQESNAILVQSSDDGCYSYVGQINWRGKSQNLNLGRGCEYLGIAAHELGHSLGMAHEQSRPDRDEYVDIHWENLKGGRNGEVANNFEIDSGAYTGTTYDAYSLMHYDANAFSSNGKPTITAKKSQRQHRQMTYLIGQRAGFSELDVEQIAKMYGCEAHPEIMNKGDAIALVAEEVAPPVVVPSTSDDSLTGELKVVVVHARELSRGGRFEEAPDGYCNVYINGEKVAKTEVIEDDRNPNWHATFSIQGYTGQYGVEFKVKDYDGGFLGLFTHGRILGRVILSPDYFHDKGGNGAFYDLKLASKYEKETLSPTLRVCISACRWVSGCGCDNLWT